MIKSAENKQTLCQLLLSSFSLPHFCVEIMDMALNSLCLSLSHSHTLFLSYTYLVIVIFLYCLCSYSLWKPGKHLENEDHLPNLTDAQYKAKMCVTLGNRSKVSVVEFSLASESDSRGCLKLLLF